MKNIPNAFQKLLHRFLMVRPVSAFLSVALHRMDTMILKFTKGKHTLAALVGLPIIQITTIGAKTGRSYSLPLVGLIDGEKIGLIASSFGRQHNPGWYYNLKAHPQCTVQINGRSAEYIAHQVEGEEYEKYWSMAVSYYKGYELYKVRVAHRQILVMILVPAK